MANFFSHGVSFFLGVAAGVALTHPEVRKQVRPLLQKAVHETVRLKNKLEKFAATSREDLEDMFAEANAQQSEDGSPEAYTAVQPAET